MFAKVSGFRGGMGWVGSREWVRGEEEEEEEVGSL